jgi:hypothetical protein
MKIDPKEWVEIARERAPSPAFMTDWFDGTVAPVHIGWYERHFTDSMSIGEWSIQYWDGEVWKTTTGMSHWRQVGDYPAWRGLTTAQIKLQESAR